MGADRDRKVRPALVPPDGFRQGWSAVDGEVTCSSPGAPDCPPLLWGAHMYLWVDRWSDHALWLLDHVGPLGLSFFEVSLGDESVFTPRLLRDRAAGLGLELTIGPGGAWPVECDISDDDAANRAKGLDWHRRMIDRAAACGAVAYCGAIYGHPGTVRRRRPPPEEIERAAEGLHLLAERAERAGLKLVIEPTSRFRSHLVNTPSQAVALVRRAGHSNLLINLDTYHLITEIRDYGKAVREAGSLLWGLHACESDRGVPGGGLVPWDAVFGAVASLGRETRIMLETYRTGPGGFAFERGIFQDLCPDPDAFVRQGTAFLKGRAARALRNGEATVVLRGSPPFP